MNDCLNDYFRKALSKSVSDKIHSAQSLELKNLIKNALKEEANNSAIIIGPQGVGKSCFLSRVVRELTEEGVRLEFLSIHGDLMTTDIACTRYISECLQKRLSTCNKFIPATASIEQHMTFIEAVIRQLTCCETRLVLALENMSKFCHAGKQGLLYNIFDLMQTKGIQLTVIGLTTRPDVLELIEKRVKSRLNFSNICLFPIEDYDELCTFLKDLAIKPLIDKSNDKIVTDDKIETDDGIETDDKIVTDDIIETDDRIETAIKIQIKECSEALDTALSSIKVREEWTLQLQLGRPIGIFINKFLTQLLSVNKTDVPPIDWLTSDRYHQSNDEKIWRRNETAANFLDSHKADIRVLDYFGFPEHAVLTALGKLQRCNDAERSKIRVLKMVDNFTRLYKRLGAVALTFDARTFSVSFDKLVDLGFIEIEEPIKLPGGDSSHVGSLALGKRQLIGLKEFWPCRSTVYPQYFQWLPEINVTSALREWALRVT
eukprot:GHVL01024152.1.p1 GENE.GHVL01024152.1~~GHVL01024152.1.p1  ORF type:complete len:488 (+),score=106.92 GHVL01024152.1:76-1539(+)